MMRPFEINFSMHARAHALAAVLAAATFGAHLAQAAPPGWIPTFSDEFEGSTLDTTKWDPILWLTPFNNERQAYHPSRVTVAGGNLVLTADDTPLGGKSYTSGKVESKFTQQYGRWEVRAKLPGTQGTWPAIWLLPDTTMYGWPTQGEIDVLENRGNQPHLTSSAYHYGPNVAGHKYQFLEQQTSVGGQLDDYHDDFHVYAVEWDADRLRFFVDDVNYYTIFNADVGGFLASQSAPMETVLNVAVGGDFLGGEQPNGSSDWPQQMLVDYVRVYERDPNAPPRVFRNTGFEADGGGLGSWSTFGVNANGNPNVLVHDETLLAGDHALKLFGQFNNRENYSGVLQGITVSEGDRVEANVSTFVRSADSIAGTSNQALLKIEYYSKLGGQYGSADMISEVIEVLADGSTAQDQWLEHNVSGVAPAGAVEARLVLFFRQPANEGGAVHFDEVEFRNLDLPTPADADGNGQVEGADFLSWQRGAGTSQSGLPADGDFDFNQAVDDGDLTLWQQQYGAATTAVVVAEPVSAALAAAALLGICEAKLRTAGPGAAAK